MAVKKTVKDVKVAEEKKTKKVKKIQEEEFIEEVDELEVEEETKEENPSKKEKKEKDSKKKKETKKEKKESYMHSVRKELKKVVWPKGGEILKYTLAVIILCVVLALFFAGVELLAAFIKGLFV